MHILSIGECMAELAPTPSSSQYSLGYAGDTFNTAWYLARCAPEITVSYLTAIGQDVLSNELRELIVQCGISDSYVQTMPARTLGLYLISLDQGERSFSYWRGQSAARCLAADPKILAQAAKAADVIYFSGITLAILEGQGRANLMAALIDARAQGKTIVFDPNLRPKLWTSVSEMLSTTMMVASTSDIVLPSFEDEADCFGDSNEQATADRYAEAGASTIIVKNGDQPVHYKFGAAQGSIMIDPLDVVTDSTAAGDSFNAGYLAAMAKGWILEDCISAGCGLSRQVVQKRGALVDVNWAPFQ